MTPPLVSVCIPTYNGERYIRRTIESVLSQSHRDLQIIISDDASSDGTLEIVKELCDERFVVVRHDASIGAEANWNASCAPATGEFIKLLCQDDVLLPHCIEHQAEVLVDTPSASFCWSPRDVISPHGRRLLRSRGYRPSQNLVEINDVVADIVRSGTNPFGEPCAVLIRRSTFIQTAGFHGQYLIDLNMWLDLLDHGPAVFLDETLSQFRISTTSWTSVLKDEHARQVAVLATTLASRHMQLINDDDMRHGERRAAQLQRQRSLLLAMLKVSRL